MKLLITNLLLFISTNAWTQATLKDSTFYNDGQLKSVNFSHDKILSGYSSTSFYVWIDNKSYHISDTVYKDFINKDFINTRRYIDDGTIIIADYGAKKTEEGYIPYQKGLCFIFQSKMFDSIYFQIWLYPDSSISAIMAGVIDSVQYKVKYSLVDIRLKEGSEIGKANNLHLGEWGDIQVNFNDKYFLSSLAYSYKNDTANLKKVISFYDNNIVKEVGYYLNDKGRIATWYEYYDNGNLMAVGNYIGTENKSHYDYDGKWKTERIETTHLKNGEWNYYSIGGKTLKTEYWKNGKLIK